MLEKMKRIGGINERILNDALSELFHGKDIIRSEMSRFSFSDNNRMRIRSNDAGPYQWGIEFKRAKVARLKVLVKISRRDEVTKHVLPGYDIKTYEYDVFYGYDAVKYVYSYSGMYRGETLADHGTHHLIDVKFIGDYCYIIPHEE